MSEETYEDRLLREQEIVGRPGSMSSYLDPFYFVPRRYMNQNSASSRGGMVSHRYGYPLPFQEWSMAGRRSKTLMTLLASGLRPEDVAYIQVGPTTPSPLDLVGVRLPDGPSVPMATMLRPRPTPSCGKPIEAFPYATA